MASLAIAFPILPGKVEQARQFAQEMRARSQEAVESFGRVGISKEEWFLQETAQGALVIVRMQADDPGQALASWALSADPFDRWFKTQAGQICGVDSINLYLGCRNQCSPGRPHE
jgi:hypothetical protein